MRQVLKSILLIDKENLLVADDNAIMIVSLSDGNITSKKVFEEYQFSSSGQPVCVGNIAYIPTANKGIVAFDLEAKDIIWNFNTSQNNVYTAPYVGKDAQSVEATAIAIDDTLIFGANDGYVYYVNRHTGKLIDKNAAASAVLGKAAYINGNVIVGTFNGEVICF